jgi:hypothetical protein
MFELDDEVVESGSWDEDILDGEADFDEAEFLPGLDILSPAKSLIQGVTSRRPV